MEKIDILQQSSLEKVFLDAVEFQPPYLRASALRGEEFAYQIVLRKDGWGKAVFSWSLESPLAGAAEVFQVESVPCGLAAYPAEDAHDDDYLSLKAGLFPDLLRPLRGNSVELSAFQNTVLWVNVTVPEDCSAGEYPIKFTVAGKSAKAESVFTLKVIPAALPKQKLLFTEWFYADCLADWYQAPVYSEEHWRLIGAYLREAAKEGVNTVLTPVLTPPLDTAVGTERTCVQLLEIEKDGDSYRFDFSRLRRFVELALESGITHFEINHLFTQWGAMFTPAVYAVERGERKRIFGWDVPSDSPEYTAFLTQLLPAVVEFFEGLGLRDRLLFHISDEPGRNALRRYRKNKELVEGLIGGLPIIDALSDPEFYDLGLVKRPVAATNHIEPFLKRQVPELWAYNCCAQNAKVGNRFLSMPSYRNRILGVQLYKYQIQGFLHWGYNFWNSWESRRRIDPFRVTDGGGAFPGGDAFAVYPGEDGNPLPSIRMKVFHHGLQDLRALELLESLAGREAVEKTLPGFQDITFADYSRDPPYLLNMRETVNRQIEQLCTKKNSDR